MFGRGKVQPSVDEYIQRHYEDTAVCIHADLRSKKGLQNHYVAWLEDKLQGFPEAARKKYSLAARAASPRHVSAWDEEAGPSTSRGTDAILQRGTERGGDSDRHFNGTDDVSSKFCIIL